MSNPTRDGHCQLSVIIPCYRSANVLSQGIDRLLKQVSTSIDDFEIIVVDDGSNDGGRTAAVVQTAGCKYIVHPVNQGKGAAVRTGMLAARGDYRIFTDADLPYGPESIIQIFKKLETKTTDIVVGDRTLKESSYFESISNQRRLASRIFSLLVMAILRGEKYDTQCGIKGFSAGATESLFNMGRINRFAFDVELFVMARRNQYSIIRHPVTLVTQGNTTVSLGIDSIQMLLDLLLIWWYDRTGSYSRVNYTK